ncbi:hypothetical protein H6504_03460 [Candidatus Woesearchaeota archaeon]|nr:hypothetical protein [Candidatus Woesearchaeota archaeon]
MMSKAQIQVQFNWIFVLIVGGMIVLFFTNVVNTQQDISEKKIAVTVINDLETVATGAGVSKGTSQVLNKPDIDLEFDCNYCDCNFNMKESAKSFGDMVIFAPNRIEGRKMVAWTKDWNAPYRIVNFLYLTGPQVIYYIISGPTAPEIQFRSFINESLPSSIITEYGGNVGTIINNNYPIVKVVYLTCPTLGPLDAVFKTDANHFKNWGIEREDLTAVCIDGDNAPFYDRGDMAFFKAVNSFGNWEWELENVSMEFVGDESIFAGIFAHDFDLYYCNMRNAYDRMNLITEIYEARTTRLSGTNCMTLYNQSGILLEYLKVESAAISADPTYSFSDFYLYHKNITSLNMQLQIKSCPSLY